MNGFFVCYFKGPVFVIKLVLMIGILLSMHWFAMLATIGLDSVNVPFNGYR